MKFVRFDSRIVLAMMLGCALAGCSAQKDTAQSLVLEIAATVSAAEPEAAQFVPEQLMDVQTQLTGLQAAFDKKDYAAIVTAAPAVLAAAQSLATAAAARKDQILKRQNDDWASLAAVLPDEVTALQSLVDLLDKKPAKAAQKSAPKSAKKTAADFDLASTHAAMTDITSLWSKAQAAFAGGNLQEALATAKDVKSKADALAVVLKVNVVQTTGST